MQKIIEMSGKPVRVSLSRAAERALAGQGTLYAEMELYFSCLVRLKVYFRDHSVGDCFQVTDKLAISFKPIMTASCNVEARGKNRRLSNSRLPNQKSFLPNG